MPEWNLTWRQTSTQWWCMRKQMQECWPRPRTKVESLRSANKDVGRRARKETTDLPRRMLDRAVRHESNSKFNTYEDLDLAESDRMMSKRRPASTKISILEKTLTTQLIDAAAARTDGKTAGLCNNIIYSYATLPWSRTTWSGTVEQWLWRVSHTRISVIDTLWETPRSHDSSGTLLFSSILGMSYIYCSLTLIVIIHSAATLIVYSPF